MLSSASPSAMLLLHSVHGRACSKSFQLVDGRVSVTTYGKETRWNAEAVDAGSLRHILSVLKGVDQHTIVVVGQLTDEAKTENIPRRKYDPGASLADSARMWVPIDIDDLIVEADNDRDRLGAVRGALPEPFRAASFIFQFTSSHGMTDNPNAVRCRLWFILDKPVPTAAWRHYFRGTPGVDPSIYSCNQPIYIAPPTFDGIADPVPRRCGLFKGSREEVCVSDLDIEAAIATSIKLAKAPTIGRLDIEPDDRQIEEAVDKILHQTPTAGRHNWALAAACELYGLGADPQLILDTFDECLRLHGRDPDPGEGHRALAYAARQAAAGKLRTDNLPLSSILTDLPPGPVGPPEPDLPEDMEEEDEEAPDPFSVLGKMLHRDHTDTMNARIFVRESWGEHGYIAWGPGEYVWTGAGWRALEDPKTLRGLVRQFGPDLTKAKKDSCVDAIRDLGHREHLALPCWITDENRPDPEGDTKHTVLFHNGVLDIRDAILDPASALRPITRRFFSTAKIPFEYDPEADCPRWKSALNDWFPGDAPAVRELQKLFGYLLTTDTSLQKVFMFIGESRAGKGVITRVLGHVIGPACVGATQIGDFGGRFGLQSMVGKTVCVINEVNASRMGDIPQAAVDRIKAISGEDAVTVEAKFGGAPSVKLPLRIILVCNQMPAMDDASSAISNRLHVFHFKHSFAGREDFKLEDKLKAEAPGILNWAIEGYRMLLEDGRFLDIPSAAEHRDIIKLKASPVRAFITECMEARALSAKPVRTQDLYDAYRAWADDQGIDRKINKIAFMLAVRTAFPHAEVTPSRGRERPAVIVGATLNAIGREFLGAQSSEWIDKES